MMPNIRESLDIKPKEGLHKGKTLPWTLWRTINRMKVACSRTKKNMHKWRLAENDKGECEVQDERHIFECPNLNVECRVKDVQDMNGSAIRLAEYWNGKL